MRSNEFEGLRLRTPPGVFEPTRTDTRLLWRSVVDVGLLPADGRVLEVCTGSGAIALSAARAGADVTAVDVSRAAIASVRRNARRLGLSVDARRGDLFGPVAGERFALVLANPPYLPLPPRALRLPAARAWDGGVDGRVLLDRLCREVPEALEPDGTVAIVHSSLADLQRTHDLLADAGLRPRLLAAHVGPLGPLAEAHRDHLQALGVLDDDGLERIAVIAATR